ncbi:MAG: hypothetical protein ACR2PX_27960 [Endozoicomonas sp.]|uniref:hypothetical protein n=1 Tax=Endozoicomonas sp. TaxID=1892382 RepID=UPI003D9BA510
MLGSLACVFLGLALAWNILPAFRLFEFSPLKDILFILSISILTVFLTVKAVWGKKWSLTIIAFSMVTATSHLAMELPAGIYFWLIGLTFCGIAFYCHVRLINQGLKNQQ